MNMMEVNMLSNKGKKILNIIVWVFVTIAIIMMIINGIMEYNWKKNHEKWEADNQAILEDALKTGNITRCEDYIKDPVKCAILVAKIFGLKVCESWGEDLREVLICKAGATGNLSLCYNDSLEAIWQRNCEDITTSVLGRVYGE